MKTDDVNCNMSAAKNGKILCCSCDSLQPARVFFMLQETENSLPRYDVPLQLYFHWAETAATPHPFSHLHRKHQFANLKMLLQTAI